MGGAILIRGARQLLTLAGPPGPRRASDMRSLGIIQDGALLLSGGVIRDVGPSRRVEHLAAARDAYEIDASGKVVMPGFVDPHTRLIGAPPCLDTFERGEVPDSGHLYAAIRSIRGYSRQRMSMEARKQLRNFVRHGTTTLDARTGLGLDESSELKMLRVIEQLDGAPLAVSPGFAGAHACPPDHSASPSGYVDWLARRLLPEVRRRRLARFADVSCGTPYGFRFEDAAAFLDAAAGLGFSVRVNSGPCAASNRAVALAVSRRAASIDGLIDPEPAEVAALASSRTLATLLPGRGFHNPSGRWPCARALIDAGAAVALGTGFDSLESPVCSVPEVLSLAIAHSGMTPAEAVTAATVNAAHALGIGSRAGALQAGYDADIVMLSAGDYREALLHFGMNPVAMVIRRGEIIYPRLNSE